MAERIRTIEAWIARLDRAPRAWEIPLRAELCETVLQFAWLILILNDVILAQQITLFWFFWAAIDPIVLLAAATWAAQKGSTHSAAVLALVAMAHSAIFTHAHYGIAHPTGACLALSIIVCGLLIGEYFVRTWTLICCAMVIWLGFTARSANVWTIVAGWCTLYIATAVLITLFSRHLERQLKAAQSAEEQRASAIVAERTRFARDIHDTLAQGFTGILMQINAAEQRLNSEPASAFEHLEKARALAKESLDEARRSVHALKPAALESGDLPTAIREAGERLTIGSPIQFSTTIEGAPFPIPADSATQLLRIAQEAFANAVRHSGAGMLTARIVYSANKIRLEIDDNGRGIGGNVNNNPGSMGLDNMKQRVHQLGGEFTVISPGQGTKLIAEIPA